VHANSLSTARIAGPVVRNTGTRSLGHLRDIIKLSKNAVTDLNQHQLLLAVSQATCEFHVRQGLDRQKCEVLYNGVDLQQFQPRTHTGYLHRELGLAENAKLIAVIGQLGLRKATDLALVAARLIVEKFPETHWLIVGERTSGKDESRDFEVNLWQAAAVPPLVGHVHFLGNRPDLALLLAECTLLVHAAHQEPLGRVLLEAAASGLAIVATNVGGTSEIFPRGSGAAILVPPNDPKEIANAATLLLCDELRRSKCGVAARSHAEEAFDIRDASHALIRKYEAVLS
jgi:glycosyltransferase involved in cell wall biosynthesis